MDINFDFDSSAIRPDARAILERNADYFTKNRASAIVIEGHCDEQGTAEYNMALGERRAQETKNILSIWASSESLMKNGELRRRKSSGSRVHRGSLG